MSTNPKTPSLPWLATFDRGFAYTLHNRDGNDIVFAVGVPVPVSEAVKDHLEETAVENRLTSSNMDDEYFREVTVRQMFTFTPNPAFTEGAAP